MAASRNAWNVSTSQVCRFFSCRRGGDAVSAGCLVSALPRYGPLQRTLEYPVAMEDGPIAQAIGQHGRLEALDMLARELL